jgi:metal-dependent amidase/aminoacylase/carboxypeptidase family protein
VAPNIIPDEAELFYYIRASTNAQLDKLVPRVTACFESAALATGCTVEFAWDAHRYKDLVTNAPIADAYTRNAHGLGVRFDCATPDNVGSTDMGNVSHVVPSIHPHFYFGAKHPEHSVGFAKQAGSVDAQHYAIREAKILAHTAIDLLCDPDLLAKVKADFVSATANE